ncbi:protein kinase [Flavobacterium sp. NG2]|uniref:protein kinase domain-containing protein n=1 Tax=Flavobacterium sp. NG2 TaxID=3097547 RepID=UPI002A808849|nr:protein kinase [Flavobacterium sp. NG2]WPR70491.1 protein kinase [Flavobacterium sp. NG2]
MIIRPLKIGDTIVGEFKVHNIFGGEGKSGMGVVYLVTNRNYPTPFVLKTFQKAELNSVQRFRAEAEAWISIGIHPNIVKALFVNEVNEQLFIAAEYIAPDEYRRNTITDYLKQGGTSTQNIIKWVAQFAYGMDYAISKGLKSHRDIKPDNLMVDEEGNLKITDFGLSKFDSEFQQLKQINLPKENLFNKIKLAFKKQEVEQPKVGLTNAGSFLGTILYASPEQILDSTKVDLRSDIYSFGVVLYQLLGAYPYSLQGRTTIEHYALMHLTEPLIEINHPLSSIAYKCLSRNPNDRYQTFRELISDLQRVAGNLKLKVPQNKTQADTSLKELYIQSLSFISLGDIAKARQLINKYLEQDKEDSSAWSLKGRIEYQLGNIDDGIKATLLSYQIDPYNSKTCNNLGIFYKEQNDLLNAIRYLTEAISIDPNNTGALTNLAIAFEEKGNFPLAADLIVRAIQLAPDKKTLHFNASNIAAEVSRQKHFEKAISILELLIKVDKDNTNNWFNLASNYWLTSQNEKAIKCFKVVEQHLPDDEQTLVSLVKLNGELANYSEAILYCEKLLDRKLSILNAICWRAQYMQANGKGQEAIEFMKSVISNNQTNDHLWVTLANMYSYEGENRKAVAMIVRARQILMENGEADNTEKMNFLREKQSHFQQLVN